MSDTENTSTTQVLPNALRFAGETLVLPGSSLLLDGQIGPGAVHAVLGVAARALVGPVGWAVFAANSYAKATTGAGLMEHLGSRRKKAEAAPAEAPAEAAPA